jgi:mannose-6-phosphate isomerase-like protein (cupin superfamily)
MEQTKYVFSTAAPIRYRFPTHTNDLVMDRSEAETSEVFFTLIEPGEVSPVHVHHDTEQIFYMLEGTGTLRIGEEAALHFPIKPGDLIRIPAHTFHSVQCEGQARVVYLSIDCFVGGRPTAEPTWEAHIHVLCEHNGWDFDKVRRP